MCTRVSMQACVHLCVFVCVLLCIVCVFVSAYVHACVFVCICVCVCVCVCMCVCVATVRPGKVTLLINTINITPSHNKSSQRVTCKHKSMHAYTHIHKYTHTHTHTCTHTHAPSRLCLCTLFMSLHVCLYETLSGQP